MSFRFSCYPPANPAKPAKPRANADDAPSQPAAKAANPLDADDLVRCLECLQLAASGVCLAAGTRGKPVVAARGYAPIRHLPRRCEGFTPHPNNADQRLGHERWPALQRFHESDPSLGSHAMPPGASVAP